MHDRGRSARVARSIAACAIAVSAAALFWPQSAGAAVRSCKPVSVGPERVAPTEAEGKRLALSAWVDDVRKGHGAQFAGWAIAIDKTLSCRRGPAGTHAHGQFPGTQPASPLPPAVRRTVPFLLS